MKPALKPATIIATIAPRAVSRSHVLGFEYEYLLAIFDFLFLRKRGSLPIHANTSCITPNGHITEQYILPTAKVRRSTTATLMMFIAITLGRNCSLAIHPSHGCTEPEKSRNNNVMPMKKIEASRILIFRNISKVYNEFCTVCKVNLFFLKCQRKTSFLLISIFFQEKATFQGGFSQSRL